MDLEDENDILGRLLRLEDKIQLLIDSNGEILSYYHSITAQSLEARAGLKRLSEMERILTGTVRDLKWLTKRVYKDEKTFNSRLSLLDRKKIIQQKELAKSWKEIPFIKKFMKKEK